MGWNGPLQTIAWIIVHREGVHSICNQNQLKRISLWIQCDK